jgi:hypothetical protein
MRKGIVFTLDALIAVAIAVIALTFITQLLSLRSGEWYKEIALYNSAQDFLTSRDKDGTLAGIFNSTDANAISNLNTLISVQIPPSMVARVNVTVCRYQGGFVCNRNISAGNNGTTPTKSMVRRVFTDTNNNYYGIATMEVWYA